MATTHVPSDFDGLPYPRVRGTQDFFHQNDRKGCKRDYLDARGHFVLGFGATGDKPWGAPPLRRRGLMKIEPKIENPHFNYYLEITSFNL